MLNLFLRLFANKLEVMCEGESSTRRGVESCFQKTFSYLKTLNRLSQVFGLALWKCFILKIEVIVFT